MPIKQRAAPETPEGKPLELVPLDNGGWVVSITACPHLRERDAQIAAFTDTADLLADLEKRLPKHEMETEE